MVPKSNININYMKNLKDKNNKFGDKTYSDVGSSIRMGKKELTYNHNKDRSSMKDQINDFVYELYI